MEEYTNEDENQLKDQEMEIYEQTFVKILLN